MTSDDKPDAGLPESGMVTGNDEVPVGRGRSQEPLTEDELAVLQQLQRPADPVTEPVEESPAAAAAAADDAPLRPEDFDTGSDEQPN